jgi:hypothetical protein
MFLRLRYPFTTLYYNSATISLLMYVGLYVNQILQHSYTKPSSYSGTLTHKKKEID